MQSRQQKLRIRTIRWRQSAAKALLCLEKGTGAHPCVNTSPVDRPFYRSEGINTVT
jgi:hypothetical protein